MFSSGPLYPKDWLKPSIHHLYANGFRRIAMRARAEGIALEPSNIFTGYIEGSRRGCATAILHQDLYQRRVNALYSMLAEIRDLITEEMVCT